ncbi:MAG: MBL fold metallo-hydrolase [Burkholderiales bacterium]|jgi:glyoxylase-like metal-dependent hydrolase (beta-lactamase superfamily II)|nr:MAG: MBL fold metallo-hydrolase [Burkholderiales bacterium]
MSSSSPPLHYPLGQAQPGPGELMSLRPGLHWLRMPMPFALNHINLWALDDELEGRPGWTIVDAGVATDPIRQAWQTLWANDLKDKPLIRMLVTHMHPDHVGNAQWLIDEFSAPDAPARLWMSATDHFAAQLACESTTGFGGPRAAEFFKEHGLNKPDDVEKIKGRSNYFRSLVPAVPYAYRRLRHDMVVPIGERDWRCLAGYGHSPEHIALFNERDGLLISGDMLLPAISTNVSVVDLEPEGDSLGLFLSSLDAMATLPADTLALPSHGLPFTGIHARIQQLKDHHDARLADVLQACRQQPSSAAEMLPVLFKRQLDLHQTTFAMGEAIAHLNYLWHRGQLCRQRDAQGTLRFEAV